jgi:hypothetical protein
MYKETSLVFGSNIEGVFMRVDLSPTEWAQLSLEVAERDQEGGCQPGECALPICCSRIGHFREAVLAIGENGGDVTDELKENLEESWAYLLAGHGPDEPWVQHPTIQRLLQQTCLSWRA